jgi:carbon-monoxide dehydrogenase medium subunit
VASAPLRATEAEQFLAGRRLTDEVIEEAARLASSPVRPLDNTDLGSRYRKWMTSVYVGRALHDLAVGDA